MKRLLTIPWLLVELLVALGIASSSSAAATPAQVNDLLKHIESNEKSLQNIRIECEAWQERSNDSIHWAKTPATVSLTAWYKGLPGSLCRLDVHRRVLDWIDGAAPYSEDSYSVAYDGVTLKHISITSGPLGQASPTERATLLPSPSNDLWHCDQCTGAALSIYLYRNSDKRSLSLEISSLVQKVADNSHSDLMFLSSEPHGGAECTRLTLGNEATGSLSWWVDPHRGYALIGRQDTSVIDGRNTLFAEEMVTKLEAVAPGVWYPTAGWHVARDIDATLVRWRFEATKVIANDPKFDASIFSPPIPDGYAVDDRITNTRYRVATTQKLTKELDDAINEALTTTRAAGQPDFPAPTEPDQWTFLKSVLIWSGVILLAFGTFVICASWLRRRPKAD